MKYYKILRSDMTHHGFVYTEGLNIDTEPFDEIPACGGGLFFSNAENILAFCNYGDLIAEVEIPIDEKVVKVENKYKSHSIVLKNIKSIWTVDTFKYFIEEGIDIHADDDWALRYAAFNGHLEVVQYLIDKGADIHAYDDYALRYAAINGYLEVVRYLIDNGANIHARNDDALRCAAFNGHLEVVQYLIDKGADIHADDDWAFKFGTTEVITYLNSLNK